MFNFIRRLFSVSSPSKRDFGPTELDHEKMSFEERKKWRREMVFRSVRDSLHTLEVLESMYKCKVSQIDNRGHYYVVMLDTAPSFAIGKHLNVNGNAGIEALIAKNTFERYAVVINGVYWRVDDSEPERPVIVKKPEVKDFEDTVPFEIEHRKTKRLDFSPVSKEEEDAFRAAMRAGLTPPVIHIGRKEYSTDLAPLEREISED